MKCLWNRAKLHIQCLWGPRLRFSLLSLNCAYLIPALISVLQGMVSYMRFSTLIFVVFYLFLFTMHKYYSVYKTCKYNFTVYDKSFSKWLYARYISTLDNCTFVKTVQSALTCKVLLNKTPSMSIYYKVCNFVCSVINTFATLFLLSKLTLAPYNVENTPSFSQIITMFFKVKLLYNHFSLSFILTSTIIHAACLRNVFWVTIL